MNLIRNKLYAGCIADHYFSNFFLFLALCFSLLTKNLLIDFVLAALALAFYKNQCEFDNTPSRQIEGSIVFCRNRNGIFSFLFLKLNYFIKTRLIHHKWFSDNFNDSEKK